MASARPPLAPTDAAQHRAAANGVMLDLALVLALDASGSIEDDWLAFQRNAHARAVENECYVAITGSVGNLPRVDNMDIQYSKSAVFSPSDFSFPSTGIMAESTPNTEMVLIADVDLDLLKHLADKGSVNNRRDRRSDLYTLKLKRKGERR